jgi:hypothetical protein
MISASLASPFRAKANTGTTISLVNSNNIWTFVEASDAEITRSAPYLQGTALVPAGTGNLLSIGNPAKEVAVNPGTSPLSTPREFQPSSFSPVYRNVVAEVTFSATLIVVQPMLLKPERTVPVSQIMRVGSLVTLSVVGYGVIGSVVIGVTLIHPLIAALIAIFCFGFYVMSRLGE